MNAETNNIRRTIEAKKSLFDDIKFIAAWEQKNQKDIWNEVLAEYVANWKGRNKSVKFPNK